MADGSSFNNYADYYENGNLNGDVSSSTHDFDLSTLNFTVSNPNDVNIDNEAPVLNSFSAQDNTLLRGDTLYIDYNATDENEFNFKVVYNDPNGNSFYAISSNTDPSLGTGVAELSITGDMFSGLYTANRVSMADGSSFNNYADYYENGNLNGDVLALLMILTSPS